MNTRDTFSGLIRVLSTSLAVVVVSSAPSSSQEPQIQRLQPKAPAEAAKTFMVLHDFRMDLIAHEPLLRDPVAIAYDEDGAMYAVEMTAYPHPERADDRALGRVRLLLDDDADGVFDSSFVFADQLSTPTSVICWKGGVFVMAPPDLWYLKDTDGDHKADIRRKVYTGFGISNAETLANNLKWGIDNKIYGATSHSGGTILRVARSGDRPQREGDRPQRESARWQYAQRINKKRESSCWVQLNSRGAWLPINRSRRGSWRIARDRGKWAGGKLEDVRRTGPTLLRSSRSNPTSHDFRMWWHMRNNLYEWHRPQDLPN